MGTSTFCKGAEVVLRGKPSRLLRRLSPNIWQVEDKETLRIAEFTRSDLNMLYVAGELKFERRYSVRTGSGSERRKRRVASDAEWEIAKRHLLYVKAVLHGAINAREWRSAITNVWKKLRSKDAETGNSIEGDAPPSFSTVYRWRRSYLAAGCDVTSLLSNEQYRGNRARRYPQEILDIVDDAIESVYLSLTRPTIQDTLDHAIAIVGNENKQRPRCAQLPVPTLNLVSRSIQTVPAFDRYSARYGYQAAVKRFRAVLGHLVTSAPLERVEIDHTPLDLIVLDDATCLPLGRPYLTACIDDYTRCILGFYISFEPPSFLTVARCLRHAILPKTYLASEYPQLKNAWDAHGSIRALIVDNGPEFHSNSLETAGETLGMEIHYCPRKKAWFKGKIERALRTFNAAVAHGKPGTTFSNIIERGDYDASKFSVVRYSTLKTIAHIFVVDLYHQKRHRTIDATPSQRWLSSIQPDDIPLADDPSVLDLILAESQVRTLSHKGIECNRGLFYNSPDLTDLRRKLGDKVDVEIRTDKADLGHIVVLSPDRADAIKVKCIDFEYANGLTDWQHRICKRHAEDNLDRGGVDGWIAAKELIRTMVAEEFMHKKRATRSRIARYQDNNKLPPADTRLLPAPAVREPEIAAIQAPAVASTKQLQADTSRSRPAEKRHYEPRYRPTARSADASGSHRGGSR